MSTSYDYYRSPIGLLQITVSDSDLIGISLVPNKDTASLADMTTSKLSVSVKNWLDQYFHGDPSSPHNLSIRLSGTPFQNYVWNILMTIPYGQTLTYGEIAEMAATHFGKPKMSAQAVGQAVSRNPFLILIPCHRVMGAGQKLTGFAVGIDIKQKLLDHEKIKYIKPA